MMQEQEQLSLRSRVYAVLQTIVLLLFRFFTKTGTKEETKVIKKKKKKKSNENTNRIKKSLVVGLPF